MSLAVRALGGFMEAFVRRGFALVKGGLASSLAVQRQCMKRSGVDRLGGGVLHWFDFGGLAASNVLGKCPPKQKLRLRGGSPHPERKAPPRSSSWNFQRAELVPGHSALAKRRVFGQDGAQGTSAVLFGHHPLEIGRGLVFRFALTASPFHKEAVAQAPEHPQDPKAIGTPHAAAIIVVRDIQPLMRAVFNAPAISIEFEPH